MITFSFVSALKGHRKPDKGSGTLLHRLYKDAGTSSTECPPTKGWGHPTGSIVAYFCVGDFVLVRRH